MFRLPVGGRFDLVGRWMVVVEVDAFGNELI